MAKIVKKSPAPLYLAAAVWGAWAVLAPLYAWWHFALAAAVSAAAAALTAFWGWTGWLAAAWFLAMLLDYATGSAAALRAGTWSSRCAREGLWHKAGSVAGGLRTAGAARQCAGTGRTL